ncbi:hypothetical protein IC582_012808 [Cucumis melo]
MAPSRKSRSVNKRFSSANEASSSKYVEDAGKSKQKCCHRILTERTITATGLVLTWSRCCHFLIHCSRGNLLTC